MRVLITGGAGFIGSNTSDKLLYDGHDVIILDNLSRHGTEKNLAWLQDRHKEMPFYKVDVRDYDSVKDVLKKTGTIDVVLHFAAQVAVTTSVENPREDFEINALGTLNVLEAIREMKLDPVFLYASTNKVYGELAHLGVVKEENRYRYLSLPYGVSESTNLDFHSPYGCSKGAADLPSTGMENRSVTYFTSTIWCRPCCWRSKIMNTRRERYTTLVAGFRIAWLCGVNLNPFSPGCWDMNLRCLSMIGDLGIRGYIFQISRKQRKILGGSP